MSKGGETGGALVSPFAAANGVRKQEIFLFPLPLTPACFIFTRCIF